MLLVINACTRKKPASRTQQLLDAYLEGRAQVVSAEDIRYRNLVDENIQPLITSQIEQRFVAVQQGQLDHPLLRYAVEFKEADKLVIAAPNWDLMFAAWLKIYLEYISVDSFTFRFNPKKSLSLSKLRSITFITTVGGYFKDALLGEEYLKSFFATFFENPPFKTIYAECTDIIEVNQAENMRKAIQTAFEAGRSAGR